MEAIDEQTSKLEELVIRGKLLSELLTPYTLDTETLTDSDCRYLCENVLPLVTDNINFIVSDIGNISDKLTSISVKYPES